MKKPEAETAGADAEALANAAAEVAAENASNAEAQVAHLNATIRDALLTHIRGQKKPWEKLSEREQGDVITAIEETARDVIREACAAIASRGFDNIGIRLKDLSIKDGRIKGKFEATMTGENVQLLAEHEDSAATIVLVEPGAFMLGPWAEAEPDQTEIPLEDQEHADEVEDDQRRAARRARR